MIYSAKVKSTGAVTGQWIVTPQYTRVDGTAAADITALSANGIKPVVGDMVLCADSRNSFDHSSFRIFDDNAGACPIIIAVFSQLMTTVDDFTIEGNLIVKEDAAINGKATLGGGSKKMVLGDDLQTWAQSVDTALTTLAAAAGKVVPPVVASVWSPGNLSTKHKLD